MKAPAEPRLSLFFAIARHGLERRSSCHPATSQTHHQVFFARVQARAPVRLYYFVGFCGAGPDLFPGKPGTLLVS